MGNLQGPACAGLAMGGAPLSHPEALAVGDPEDFAAVHAEIQEADAQSGFDAAGGEFLNLPTAMRAKGIGVEVFTDSDSRRCHAGSVAPSKDGIHYTLTTGL